MKFDIARHNEPHDSRSGLAVISHLVPMMEDWLFSFPGQDGCIISALSRISIFASHAYVHRNTKNALCFEFLDLCNAQVTAFFSSAGLPLVVSVLIVATTPAREGLAKPLALTFF